MRHDENPIRLTQLVRENVPTSLRLHSRVVTDIAKKKLRFAQKPGTQVGLRFIATRLSRSWSGRQVFREPQFRGTELTYTLPILGSSLNIVVHNAGNEFLVGVYGINAIARHWLNDMVVTDTRLKVDSSGREIHVYGYTEEPSEAAVAVHELYNLIVTMRLSEEYGNFPADEYIRAYWASKVINFGDWIGPHLIRQMSGRRPLRENRPGGEGRIAYSVGSILGWITKDRGDVWGSGLIRPLTEAEVASRKKLRDVSIHAVRGRLTREHLIETLGWDVPAIYGDPALLLPRFYQPVGPKTDDIAFTPHGVHRKYFDRPLSPSVKNVHVRRDFRDVSDAIASSRAVVSTSLHGLITAQAYGVPWIWLNIENHALWGEEFKFNDFFSTLDTHSIPSRRVTVEELATLDFDSLAAEAHLPDINIDLDLLERSCPFKRTLS